MRSRRADLRAPKLGVRSYPVRLCRWLANAAGPDLTVARLPRRRLKHVLQRVATEHKTAKISGGLAVARVSQCGAQLHSNRVGRE